MVNKKNILIPIIGFSWLLIVVLGYFVTHKPVFPSEMVLLVSHVWKILLIIWLMSVAGGIGKTILKHLDADSKNRFYLEVALGLGIVSITILLIGSFWRVNFTILFVLLLLLTVLFFRQVKLWLSQFLCVVKTIKINSTFSKILVVCLGIIFFSQLFVSLAPATRYDALNYHLTLPKSYLLQEKITDIPWLVMSGMPQISEMIYVFLMGLGGESAPLVFNWIIGLLIGIGLLSFIGERLNSSAAWVTVTSLYGGLTFASALSWGYVDLMAAFFGLAVFLSIVDFFEYKTRFLIFLAGIFSGLAFGCKYPAGVMFLAVLLTLIVNIFKNKLSFSVKNLVYFGFGAALLALPWLLKNLIFTGNPIYPFFFESGSMTQIRLDVYQGLPPYGNLLDLIFLPIQATIMGVEGTNGYSVSMGPLLLGLGVLAFLDWKNKSDDKKFVISLAGLITLFGITIWAVGNQFSGYLIQTRFYFVLFPVLAVLAGYGYDQVSSYTISSVRIKKLVNPIIVLVIAFNSFQLFTEMVQKGVLKNILGYTNNQQYLEDNLGWYARAISDIKTLPEGSKVLLIYEPRGYGCIPNCDPDEILDHWKTTYHQIETNEKIISEWMNEGYSHLLVYAKGIEFLRENYDPHHPEQELDALEELLSTVDLVENFGGWYQLYRLEPD